LWSLNCAGVQFSRSKAAVPLPSVCTIAMLSLPLLRSIHEEGKLVLAHGTVEDRSGQGSPREASALSGRHRVQPTVINVIPPALRPTGRAATCTGRPVPPVPL
jgi:hypothetical protein